MMQRSANERSIWISALTNRLAVEAMMTDKQQNRRSMFVMMERVAAHYGLPISSMGFLPVYNPADSSQWPELLGWLLTFGEMVNCEN
jgi:hypothetical protein